MIPMALVHVVCCGALLLFVSGAAIGIGGLLSDSGLAWIAGAVALGAAGILLWKRRAHQESNSGGRHTQHELEEHFKTKRSPLGKSVG
jgi:hypothetical protein